MNPERGGYDPEAHEGRERVLEGEERERFLADQREYITGLEAALADPDLDDETRAELTEQLGALKDSLEAAEAGREIAIKG